MSPEFASSLFAMLSSFLPFVRGLDRLIDFDPNYFRQWTPERPLQGLSFFCLFEALLTVTEVGAPPRHLLRQVK
jgi:hypothetical protein